MRFRPAVAMLGALSLAAACEPLGVVCTDEAVPALSVQVLDSISGDPVPDPLVWVRDGLFVDTLESAEGSAWGPYERAGTYEVHVEHEGYAPWARSGIRVREDECHVLTRDVAARLQPAQNGL